MRRSPAGRFRRPGTCPRYRGRRRQARHRLDQMIRRGPAAGAATCSAGLTSRTGRAVPRPEAVGTAEVSGGFLTTTSGRPPRKCRSCDAATAGECRPRQPRSGSAVARLTAAKRQQRSGPHRWGQSPRRLRTCACYRPGPRRRAGHCQPGHAKVRRRSAEAPSNWLIVAALVAFAQGPSYPQPGMAGVARALSRGVTSCGQRSSFGRVAAGGAVMSGTDERGHTSKDAVGPEQSRSTDERRAQR